MENPNNAAAEQIIRAQSIVSDLTTQMGELQSAINRQLDLIDALTPIAEWAPAEETAEVEDDNLE